MRIKTIVIILITVLLTIMLVQNSGPMWFSFLFFHHYISKLLVMLFVAIVAFVLGYLAGRPKRAIRLGNGPSNFEPGDEHPDTLSEEDRDYIG
jgi:uncharacterized integral membrane protein